MRPGLRALPLLLVLLTACPASETATPPSPGATGTTPRPSPTASPNLGRARVRLDRIATLEQPVAMAMRRDDDTIYLAEKTGRVVALEGRRTRSLLDLGDEVSRGSEQGLLGLAFSPDGTFLYVNYTNRNGNTRVEEFSFRDGRVDRASRRRVLAVDQPFANHNGGNLVFGPDGLLYVGLGDGGSAGDPRDNAQNLGRLLGKMLRIDPRPSGGRPYRIPPDNPFVDREGARGEIWAYGLRNPWRYSFDRGTGDLWIADVGQSGWEEINVRPAASRGGENYGWPLREGTHTFDGRAPAGAIEPVHEYAHAEGGCSVTGGFVYRGGRIPPLAGAYLYGDYCDGRISAIVVSEGRVAQRRRLLGTDEQVASFGEDHDGELYVLSLAGGVFRLVPS